MGKIDFRTGTLRGKLGALVGSPFYGKQVVRSASTPIKSLSTKQITLRKRIKQLSVQSAAVRKLPLFSDFYRFGKGTSSFAEITRMNTGHFEDDFDNPSDVILSVGLLAGISSHGTASITAGVATIPNVHRTALLSQSSTDYVAVVIYSPSPFIYLQAIETSLNNRTISFAIDDVSVSPLWCLVFFFNKKGMFSNSTKIAITTAPPVNRPFMLNAIASVRGDRTGAFLYSPLSDSDAVDTALTASGNIVLPLERPYAQHWGASDIASGWFSDASYYIVDQTLEIFFDEDSDIIAQGETWRVCVAVYNVGTGGIVGAYSSFILDNIVMTFDVPGAEGTVRVVGCIFSPTDNKLVSAPRSSVLTIEIG